MTYGWRERLEIEHDELVNKIGKLEAFLDNSDLGVATSAQTELLYRQYKAMREYAGILKERLGMFT
jgi:hypothetical protein